tara:strand:- start:178 stop:375 length:198 start_codon:yes stop_codon:yes gene_type:complete
MFKKGNLVRLVHRQGWKEETDPGIGLVLAVRSHEYLLDEIKVRWRDGKTEWTNSGLLRIISSGTK